MKLSAYFLLFLSVSAAVAETNLATTQTQATSAQTIPAQTAPTKAIVGKTIVAPAELAPSSLANGESFYVIFVTSGLHNAESASQQTYNSFVNRVADSSSIKATNHPDIDWKALVATQHSNPEHNVFSQDTQRPIYNILGEKVADSAEQLLSGRLFNKIKYTETGSHAASPLLVWTGLMANGEPAGQFVLGNKQAALGSYIFQSNGARHFKVQSSYFKYRFYAVSPLLTKHSGKTNMLSRR